MNRPAPRKSSLSKAHPAAPAEVAQQTAPSTESPAPASQPKTKGPAASGRTKMTFYTTEDQAGQVRAFLSHVPSAQHGYRNVSEFLDAAVATQVQVMQEKYNQGRPWPPADAGTVARGRPVE